MPILANPRWEAFAAARVFDRLTIYDAYAKAGYKGTRRMAERVSAHPEVQARIAELQQEAKEARLKAETYSRETVIHELLENVKESKRGLVTYQGQVVYMRDPNGELILDDCGNPQPLYRREGRVINQALELLGLEKGMFPRMNKLEHSKKDPFEGLTPQEILLELRNSMIAELGWDMPLDQLAKMVGIAAGQEVKLTIEAERGRDRSDSR